MNRNFKGEIDFASLKRSLFSFNSVLVETNTIQSNTTELFEVDEESDIVDNISFTPSNRELPRFGRIVQIRVNVVSGSTDTTLSVYEGEEGNDIDQTAQIENLSINTSPESFLLGDGPGVPFVNQEDNNALHLEINELSGADSQYQIKLLWSNVGTPKINPLSV